MQHKNLVREVKEPRVAYLTYFTVLGFTTALISDRFILYRSSRPPHPGLPRPICQFGRWRTRASPPICTPVRARYFFLAPAGTLNFSLGGAAAAAASPRTQPSADETEGSPTAILSHSVAPASGSGRKCRIIPSLLAICFQGPREPLYI